MKYLPNQVYHIYNQGNNKQTIFFQERNYDYFMMKMRKHLLPFVDVLAYCLMPNHFHWLVRTKKAACNYSNGYKPMSSQDLNNIVEQAKDAQWEHLDIVDFFENVQWPNRQQNLCHEIGQMLRAYAKAINKQERRSGSLFRKRTKAKHGMMLIIEEVDLLNGITLVENACYQKICFDYIHQNPVKARLVAHEIEWPYSSAAHYDLNIPSDLCNKERARSLGLIESNLLIYK